MDQEAPAPPSAQEEPPSRQRTAARLRDSIVDELNAGTHAPLALGVAMLIAAGFLWGATERQWLFGDEVGFLLLRDLTFEGLLSPDHGHALLLPMLFYQGVFEVFGIDSYAPIRSALIASTLACSGLLFLYLRRRVGGWAAAAGAGLLLVLGAAWETQATGNGTTGMLAVAFGLGALLALDRGDRRGDVLAALLLAASIFSFSTGLIFAVGAAIRVAARHPGGTRGAWIWAAPAALYAVWALWAARFDEAHQQSRFDLENLPNLPAVLIEGLGGTAATLTGLFREPGVVGGPVFRLELGVPIAIGLIALLAWQWIRGRRIGGDAWAAIAMVAAFWAAVGMVMGEVRPTLTSRFFFPGTVFFLIAAAELIGPLRLGPRPWAVAGVVFASALTANAFQLHYGADAVSRQSDLVRAELAALELARGEVDSAFQPDGPELRAELTGDPDQPFAGIPILTAGAYFDAADEFGSAAYSPQELEGRPASVRRAADIVLARALGLELEPVEPAPPLADDPPPLLSAQLAEPVPRAGCLDARRQAAGAAIAIAVQPAGISIAARRAAAAVALSRFADGHDVVLGRVEPGTTALLRIPSDRHELPWTALVTVPGGALVCSVAAS